MNPKIAYLEISPRQTGKTKRLVQFANELYGQGRTVIFVTYLAKFDLGLVPGVIVLSDGKSPPPGIDLSNAVWFYDEFDWLKSTKIRAGAYYATTAKKVRRLGVDTPENDLLLRLIEVNGLHFQRHFWFFGLKPDSWLTECRATYSAEEFRAFILGEFLS
ncbi:hypothetical protein [Pseudomonas haemolytica]|uniref:hypothetical protein n=1 Tax=Pseudomonas haemolytica TaxID=2600065 RepID=UPI00190AD1DA|nr:hypothetical protein [Pseudomonas haemolytica]MBK3450053.1 hypothetical protein [Pseudomonas haemolytica]